MMELQYRRVGPDETRRREDEFLALYERVYANPPYGETPEDVAAFGESLLAHIDRPGFTLVTAESAPGQLYGFAYGFAFPPGRWWRFKEEAPVEIARAEKFAVLEWVVDPNHRGNRIGRGLMDRLLEGRNEPYATLCAHPQAEVAMGFYRKQGWKSVGVNPTNHLGDLEVLVLNLNRIKTSRNWPSAA